MTLNLLFLLVGSVLVAAGRFTVPGHGLTYAGSYEAFAHIWVGVLLVLSFQRNWYALAMLVVLTVIEGVKFATR